MKLNKIRFAMLVGYIERQFAISFSENDLYNIDVIADVEIPLPPEPPMMNPETLHVLMSLMQEGEQKIEAIKQYRMMTGYGLKESKDIVEKYWPNSYSKEKLCNKLNLYAANDAEHSIIAKFIEKLI